MIKKNDISQNLKELNVLYNNASTNKKKRFYSKLAVLELCGWLEDSMDKIVLDYCNKKICNTDNVDDFNIKVKNTYGFNYKDNFRPLIISLIGFKGIEKLETHIGQPNIDKLKSLLGTWKKHRNNLAHSYTNIKGTTPNISVTPSIAIDGFNNIYPILNNIEKQIKKIH